MPIVSAVISPDTGRGHAFKNTLSDCCEPGTKELGTEQGGSL